MFDIQEELKKLPEKPGVYLMKDQTDDIIYVGKAINLKNRVRQYFQKSNQHTPKVKAMVAHIVEFEYIVTDSELEALILECNLIKKHRPRYNVLLKDDKHYPYIKLTVNEPYPRVLITRDLKKDGAKYFGPYMSGYAVRETLEFIQKLFPIRDCSLKFPRDIGKNRPCLQYHIGQCIGPCIGNVKQEDYMDMIKKIMQFLNGKQDEIVEKLQKEMKEAAVNLDFEKAAELRNKIFSIQSIMEKQKIIQIGGEDQDAIAFARAGDEALVQIFFIRGGKIIGREHFLLNGVEEIEKREVMTAFIKQFYAGTAFIPKELILQYEVEGMEVMEQWLSHKKGTKVQIRVPQKGEKVALIEMVANNAILTLEQFGEKIKKEERRTKQAAEEIRKALGIMNTIYRLEAYDISNTQGVDSVGTMVVFEEGKPKKSDYRKFKIKSVLGPDDYASMEEVLERRFSRALNERNELREKGVNYEEGKFSILPDLILMDGGKGQVNVALKVLERLKLSIPVAGMVKDDKHRTRGLYYKGELVALPKNEEGFKLLTRIQDEVHRFSIAYHRSLRDQGKIKSILEDIKGVGEKRRKALLSHFGSVDKIKEATTEQLAQVEGMNQKSAEAVYEFFHVK